MELVLVQIMPPRRDRSWSVVRLAACVAGLLPLLTIAPTPVGAGARVSLLTHVSYDVTRELYQMINPAFAAVWKAQTGETVQLLRAE